MIIKRVKLTNFMNIPSTDLDFTKGTNILHGRSRQGKSAIFDAIAYCLLDRTRSKTWKDYVRKGSKEFVIEQTIQMTEDASDEMFFTYKGNLTSGTTSKQILYKGNTYTNSECGTFLSTTFDIDMLTNVVFSLQDSAPITMMEPAVRQNLFKKIFNSEFSDLVESIKRKHELKSAELTTLQNSISVLTEKKYPFFRIEEVDQSNLEPLRLELEATQASALVKEKYKNYLSKINDRVNLQNELNKLEEEKAAAILKKTETEDSIVLINIKKDQTATLIDLREKELKDKKEQVTKANSELIELEASILSKKTASNDKIKRIEEVAVGVQEEKFKAMASLSLNKKYLETFNKGLCPECGQTCDSTKIDTFSETIKTLNEAIEKYNNAGKEYALNIKTEKDYQPILDKELSTFKESILPIKEAYSKLSLNIENLKDTTLKQFDNEIALINDRVIPQLNNSIKSIDDKLAVNNTKIADLSLWIETNKVENPDGDGKREIATIQKEIDKVLADIQAVVEQEKINKKLKEDKKQDEITLAAKTEQLNTLQLELSNIVGAKEVFEKDFPAFINLKACSLLETYMNNFFSSTTGDFLVQLAQDKKGIDFFYKRNSDPDWIALKMVSGFETSLVTLGFNIAVARAFGSNLLVLDEPDGKADDESSEQLFNIIRGIQGFDQIFIITHKPEIVESFIRDGANAYKVINGEFSKETLQLEVDFKL